MLGNLNFFKLIHSSASLHCFIFLVIVTGLIILIILGSILKYSGKKYILAVHLAEMDTDPDRQALDANADSAK